MDLCGSLWISVDLCGSLWISVDLCGSVICACLACHHWNHVAAVVVPPRATLGSRHSAVEPHEINLHLFRRKPC